MWTSPPCASSRPLRSGGTNRAEVVVTHPPFSYTVQFGDTFFDIAYAADSPSGVCSRPAPMSTPG